MKKQARDNIIGLITLLFLFKASQTNFGMVAAYLIAITTVHLMTWTRNVSSKETEAKANE